MQPTKPPVIPYNTGKVKIGLYYEPPVPRSAGRDAYTLQTALLSRSPARGPKACPLFAFLKGFV